MQDLRRGREYLSENAREEFAHWEEHNIFFNTLFFAREVKGADVEFSEGAVSEYKKMLPYKDWEIWKDGVKSKLQSKSGKISADLMTGWWNPVKHFLHQSGSRRKIIKELYDTYAVCKDYSDTEMVRLLAKEFGRSEDSCGKMLAFLKVVYTPGNMIPIACSYPAGSSLDGWDRKLMQLFDKDCRTITMKKWRKYIKGEFGTLENFVHQNKLEFFFIDQKIENGVELFWKRTGQFQKATDEEWGTYFDNARRKIEWRNGCL